MSEPRRVELTFLGQALALRTEAPPEYIRRLAKFVEERVGELKRAGVKDPMKALSLAALDIADELFRTRDEKSSLIYKSSLRASMPRCAGENWAMLAGPPSPNGGVKSSEPPAMVRMMPSRVTLRIVLL